MHKNPLFMITAFLFSALFFGSTARASANKILAVVAASGFNETELFESKRIFEEAGFKVILASSSLKECASTGGKKISPDITIDKADIADYDAVVFIGGNGSSEYWDNPVAHKLARDAVSKQKVLAAICIAPVTLANAGVLKKKKATVWQSEANSLSRKGAVYTGADVESDGNIITASGPHASVGFAKAVLKALGR